MFEISVTTRFPAAHRLRLADGTLEPLHEHDWRVTVTLAARRLDSIGVVADFGRIRAQLAQAVADMRGTNLAAIDALEGQNPSAENVARLIADRLAPQLPAEAALVCVEIEEEPGCVARYRPGA